MTLESATYIDGLVASNPTATDPASQGDDHIRMIKSVLKATFPAFTGALTLDQAALNGLGVSPTLTVKGNASDADGDTVDVGVTDLQNMLGLAGAAFKAVAYFAKADHNHDATYAAISHKHNASDINTGTLAAARLPGATLTTIGAVEKATNAEMTAGTDDKYPDCAKVKKYVDDTRATALETVSISLTAVGKTAASHSLGAVPKNWTCHLVCETADAPYVVGERVDLPGSYSSSGAHIGIGASVTDTQCISRRENGFRLPNDAGAYTDMTPSRWKIEFNIYG